MIAALAGLGVLGIPAFGATPARPGTVNYIEGAAFLDGNQLNGQQIGSAAMNAGDELTTQNGKAEVLLTPGIYLRVDSNSAVKMISPDLAQTQVELDRGRAGVEVDQIFPQNNVQVIDSGVTTQLLKTGYYEFDAAHPEALVFKGRAEVELGDNRWETVKGHHEMTLIADTHEKTNDFNASGAGDELYNWSSLRSQYLAEANNQIAGDYAYGPGFYPGWYWDPYAWDYTFIGMNPFWSPFGWGFYPWGGYMGGWGGFYGHPGYGYHGGRSYGGGMREGGFAGGGFAGGGFHGGGFHGGSMRGGR
jgi:FecR protein